MQGELGLMQPQDPCTTYVGHKNLMEFKICKRVGISAQIASSTLSGVILDQLITTTTNDSVVNHAFAIYIIEYSQACALTKTISDLSILTFEL